MLQICNFDVSLNFPNIEHLKVNYPSLLLTEGSRDIILTV